MSWTIAACGPARAIAFCPMLRSMTVVAETGFGICIGFFSLKG